MFWLLHVSVTGVLDEVDAGGRHQTGTAPLHVLTMTTWRRQAGRRYGLLALRLCSAVHLLKRTRNSAKLTDELDADVARLVSIMYRPILISIEEEAF